MLAISFMQTWDICTYTGSRFCNLLLCKSAVRSGLDLLWLHYNNLWIIFVQLLKTNKKFHCYISPFSRVTQHGLSFGAQFWNLLSNYCRPIHKSQEALKSGVSWPSPSLRLEWERSWGKNYGPPWLCMQCPAAPSLKHQGGSAAPLE